MDKNLIDYLKGNNIPYETSVDLKKKTWIHRGGICDLFISPNSSEQLLRVAEYLYGNKIGFHLFGHTSNLYVLNTSNISVVLSTKKCNKYELFDDKIVCESGVGVIRIANDMVLNGVSGFEYLTGLPGTIGAAIYNNSSCKNNSISQLLIDADVLLEDGRLVTMTSEDMCFSFRTSIFKEGRLRGVIIRARLKVQHADAVTLQMIAKANSEDRERRLEGHAKNLGCTVNRCFINGRMPIHYYVLYHAYFILLKIMGVSSTIRKKKAKDFLCKISGYKKVAPYISNINPIIFVWRDENADEMFPLYLDFMRKVYKTDKVEIEII